MTNKLSPARESYLRAIYDLTLHGESASTTALADLLQVTPASASGMIQRMATMDPPLVHYHKHQGAVLSAQGEREALRILRRHRLLELFLVEVLGYDWSEVHQEADRLEHVISPLMEDRIAQKLGEPAYDPHGDPIPTRDLHLPHHATVKLRDVVPGNKILIRRVDARDPDLLTYLGEVGLRPNRSVTVIERIPLNGTMHLHLEGQATPLVIGMQVAEQIFVEILTTE